MFKVCIRCYVIQVSEWCAELSSQFSFFALKNFENKFISQDSNSCKQQMFEPKQTKISCRRQFNVSSLSDHIVHGTLYLKKTLIEPETHFWALGLRAASVIWLHQVYFV